MKISEMIMVLQAAGRGEKIEMRHHCDTTGRWYPIDGEWHFESRDYRIAPKKEPKLVPHWPAIVRSNVGYSISDSLYATEKEAEDDYDDFVRLATELPPIMLEVKE
jgi:hypothetical protein